MCNTITAVDTLPSVQDDDGKFKYTIPCYVLPHDLPKLTEAMSKHGGGSRGGDGSFDNTRADGAHGGDNNSQNPSLALPQRYMVKPLDHGEGHGIFVATTIDEILNTKNEYMESENRLVQPFVADPFLINGKKFDLRTYVLTDYPTMISFYVKMRD